LGSEFVRAVDACLSGIGRNPLAYQVIHEQVRRALIRKFPYTILYVFEQNTVFVLACFHARRDPKRWID
jgi:plasmid stabilization system protein ParE